jgi:hypothetical protein
VSLLLPRTGDPPEDGRYVVFAVCASQQVRDWCEPHIATWHGGRWHFHSPVLGWIGPLPQVRAAALPTWDEVFSDKEKTEGGWRDRAPHEYDL